MINLPIIDKILAFYVGKVNESVNKDNRILLLQAKEEVLFSIQQDMDTFMGISREVLSIPYSATIIGITVYFEVADVEGIKLYEYKGTIELE